MDTTKPHAGTGEPQLKRGINTFLLFFFVVGDILGSGIYALVGQIAGEVGGAIWVSFAVAVLFALLTAFSYAELVTKYPQAAGASLYVNRAFKNDFLTFLVTFCILASGLSAVGVLATVFGGRYFQEFIAAPTPFVAVVFVLTLAAVNFRGITESVWLNTAMSFIELSGLALILVIGGLVVFGGQADFQRPFTFAQGQSVPAAALGGATLAFFALMGFENAVNVAEETQNPSKVYPRALLGGLVVAGLIYLAISFTASMVVPTNVLANSNGPLLEVVEIGAPWLPSWLFSFAALVAVTNTALVTLIMVSRVTYGMANEGIVPRVLGRTHHSRHTPWVAIMFTTLAALVLMFAAGNSVGTLADITVLFIQIVFVLVNASVLVLRRDRVEHEHFHAPTIIPILAIASCLVLLAQQTLANWIFAGQILLIGVVLYGVNYVARRRLDAAQTKPASTL